jgi:hypothetical protein
MERSSWRITAVYLEGIAWEPGVRQRQARALAAAIGEEPHARLPAVELGQGRVTVRFVVTATGVGSALRLGLEVIGAASWAAPQLLGELQRETVRPDNDHPELDLGGEVERLLDDPPTPMSEEWIERTRWTRGGFYRAPEDPALGGDDAEDHPEGDPEGG